MSSLKAETMAFHVYIPEQGLACNKWSVNVGLVG